MNKLENWWLKVADDFEKYMVQQPEMLSYLKWLRKLGKKIFICSNSRIDFMDVILSCGLDMKW